ncbi:MAG TPA: Rdx family protein [Pirellulales bacterium]|nr:Rdx family protein [Pirellulales bacterium]
MAVSLASRILAEFKMQIESLKLVPDKGGCFEVSLNGDLVYSKLKTGEFPDEPRMLGLIGKQLKTRL